MLLLLLRCVSTATTAAALRRSDEGEGLDKHAMLAAVLSLFVLPLVQFKTTWALPGVTVPQVALPGEVLSIVRVALPVSL